MAIESIGSSFPENWLWGKYEKIYIESLRQQINSKYPDDQNLLINLTWFCFGGDDVTWKQFEKIIDGNREFHRVFMLSTVDPYPQGIDELSQKLIERFPNVKIFRMGNANGPYHFNFFAPVLAENFVKYDPIDLHLTDIQWIFISYNRKPHAHRSHLVMELLNAGLDEHGIITLGRSSEIWDDSPRHRLYLSCGERNEDYVSTGHWFSLDEPDLLGIPHDVLSLHRFDFWKQHFLHIVNATQFINMPELFVSETQFKPMIGLRPFVINGDPKTYQWLEDHGFKHFNRYWNDIDLTDPLTLHSNLIILLKRLISIPKIQLIAMWNDMLPDLEYNRLRFFEFAQEQDKKIRNLI